MKILYCDCFSGISGDMFLSALLDAGMPLDYLLSQLRLLGLPEQYSLDFNRIQKGAIIAGQIEIEIEEDHHPADPEAHSEHEEEEHSENHHHHHYHSHGRTWRDIQTLIQESSLSIKVKETSLAIFQTLAEAEARVHGVKVEEVHFHEVGAVDSILDIVGAAIGLDFFKIEKVYASALPMGTGQVQTQHGILPLPAPATLELLKKAHAKLVPSPVKVELVTPTGAAILAALATFEQPGMAISGLGTGSGHKELPWPNILRLIFGECDSASGLPMVQIETNIDDMNPQLFGHVMNKLFAAGALDVYYTPIQMKKNRPATMLSVIAWRSDEAALARLILEETTTMGMRILPIYRIEADRKMEMAQTEYGEIPLKLKMIGEEVIQASPEYDVCARLAEQHQVPLIQVYNAALQAGRGMIRK
jgi:pyridinium-3,5-bisthiocarboxylic acid mononucleotide nickel chelatase